MEGSGQLGAWIRTQPAGKPAQPPGPLQAARPARRDPRARRPRQLPDRADRAARVGPRPRPARRPDHRGLAAVAADSSDPVHGRTSLDPRGNRRLCARSRSSYRIPADAVVFPNAYLLSRVVAACKCRPDPAIPDGDLWLSGWERTNLGSTLAAHGANLVGDPHREQNFFARSDNFVLAKKGIVAQTVSSYGLHGDYHQPSDDLAHIDFKHMDAAICSLVKPIKWLVNSDFVPKWSMGGRP